MYRIERTFTNELGNEIAMAVTAENGSVTVTASGPTSEVDHTWTSVEAMWLMNLLMDAHTYGGSNEGIYKADYKE